MFFLGVCKQPRSLCLLIIGTPSNITGASSSRIILKSRFSFDIAAARMVETACRHDTDASTKAVWLLGQNRGEERDQVRYVHEPYPLRLDTFGDRIIFAHWPMTQITKDIAYEEADWELSEDSLAMIAKVDKMGRLIGRKKLSYPSFAVVWLPSLIYRQVKKN